MRTTPMESERVAADVRRAVEDAIWAPSVHNTQPWRFGVRGARITLRADPDRRLGVADPMGREMLISCGAALYTLRLSLRMLGYDPVVHLLPDPDRPHLLADVDLRPGEPADAAVELEHAQIRRRHSHRGGFLPDPVPAGVQSLLRHAAEREGARLVQAVDANVKGALAALTDAAEHIQRRSPAYATEIARWAPAPGTSRRDGVQEGAYPQRTPQTAPYFPARDFARGQGWGTEPDPDDGTARSGLVVLLVSGGDTPAHWLKSGQALQRVLLRAAEHGLSAAYHTQALQIPDLRAFIRTQFCADADPQLLLRLGAVEGEGRSSVRRPVEEVLTGEPG
ncbi:Acg family FMN-binding oxidoreductase [Spirillospora sp. NPDC048823]|uniref:Acg family FMN-binding oxidoreductase n=1 Tax=unclassified Spirillospora TaxID=2642701 RepID=UPI003718C090